MSGGSLRRASTRIYWWARQRRMRGLAMAGESTTTTMLQRAVFEYGGRNEPRHRPDAEPGRSASRSCTRGLSCRLQRLEADAIGADPSSTSPDSS